MSSLDLRGVANAEVVFGLVAPLGAPIERVSQLLAEALATVGYAAEEMRLSSFLQAYAMLDTPHPVDSAKSASKFRALMDRGDQLRQLLGRNDALAMHAVSRIASYRELTGGSASGALEKRAFILRQLKHQDEVTLLRQVYGDAFHLIGLNATPEARIGYLENVLAMPPEDAAELMARDAGGQAKHGQQLTKTFYRSDYFIDASSWSTEAMQQMRAEIQRYVDLLFGVRIITPTLDEYGMYLADGASRRSADLSRQVGASILTERGEVLALGANEVPAPGGGPYWGVTSDARDFVLQNDANEVIKMECVQEVLDALDPPPDGLSEAELSDRIARAAKALENTRLMNLTEFGRAVHAEVDAILAAGRTGVSVVGQTLCTTTFPCHNCAKHIVAAGLKRVVFVEPYPKSLAARLHGDAIRFSPDGDEAKVRFVPFVGVAPRMYGAVFASVDAHGTALRRKLPGGKLDTTPFGLRRLATPLTHIDREGMVAETLSEIQSSLTDLPPTEQ